MKIAISNNRASLGKIEQVDKDAWRIFNGSFSNVDIEPSKLMSLIQQGYAYTAQHDNYRHSKNFIQGQHIALDFDTQDDRSSFDHLLQKDFIRRYAAFLHTTPSHTEDKPKARVVLILDKPIKDAVKYAELMTALVNRFDLSDKACKDAARFFYGAMGCETHWLGNILTLETAAHELVFPYREKLQAEQAKAAEMAKNRVVTASSEVPQKILQKHSQSLIDRVSGAGNGEKYVTLRDTAITFGGYVAAGYYSFQDVTMWLQNAIQSNPNNVQDLGHAFSTIEESVNYGMGKPLYFELSKDYTLDDIEPPLTDSQKIQVSRVIDRQMWKAFHDGMTQPQRETWHKHGLDNGIIDYLNLGYINQRIDPETGEILSQDALTVPYRDKLGNVVNVEYRSIDGADYETEIAISYYPDLDMVDKPLVLMPDSVSAIHSYLHLGGMDYCIAGSPRLPLDELEHDKITVILEPDTKPVVTNQLKETGHFVRLPMPISTMLGYGLNQGTFTRYINQARRIS